MTEPYWSDELLTLYCGDYMEVIESIDIPENSGWIVDPPWDCRHFISAGRKVVFCDGSRQQDVIRMYGAPNWIFTWDCVSSWYTKNRPLRRAKYAFWYGPLSEYVFDGSHYGAPCGVRRSVSNSRGSYVFEPSEHGKHLSDIFSKPITSLHKNGHKHEKPIEWISMLVANCLGSSSVIVDPFAGSGVTLSACRKIRKPCIAIEIDELTCERIATERLSQQELAV